MHYTAWGICWVAALKNFWQEKSAFAHKLCVWAAKLGLAMRGKYKVTESWPSHFFSQVMLCTDLSLCGIGTLCIRMARQKWWRPAIVWPLTLVLVQHGYSLPFPVQSAIMSISGFTSHQISNKFKKTHHIYSAEYLPLKIFPIISKLAQEIAKVSDRVDVGIFSRELHNK